MIQTEQIVVFYFAGKSYFDVTATLFEIQLTNPRENELNKWLEKRATFFFFLPLVNQIGPLLHLQPTDVLYHVTLDSIDLDILLYVFHILIQNVVYVFVVGDTRPFRCTFVVLWDHPKFIFLVLWRNYVLAINE